MTADSRKVIAAALLAAAAAYLLAGRQPQAQATRAVPESARADHQAGLDKVRGLIAERRWADAESLAHELLAGAEVAQGPDSLAVAEAIDALVSINYASAGAVDPAGALELAERAIRIKEALLGPDDEELA